MLKKIIVLASILLSIPVYSYAYTYGSDVFTQTCTASNEFYGTCDQAFDNNEATSWQTDFTTGFPSSITNDTGTSTYAGKFRLLPYADGDGNATKNFTLYGSNDNWTSSSTLYSGTTSNHTTPTWEDYEINSGVSYRYYKIIIFDNWRGDGYTIWKEAELLQCTDCFVSPVATSTAYTEICTTGATSTSCYRPLDVYKMYAIDGLFILVPLFIGAWLIKRRKKNVMIKL